MQNWIRYQVFILSHKSSKKTRKIEILRETHSHFFSARESVKTNRHFHWVVNDNFLFFFIIFKHGIHFRLMLAFWSLDLLEAIQGIAFRLVDLLPFHVPFAQILDYFFMFWFQVLTCLRIVSIHIILSQNKFRHV